MAWNMRIVDGNGNTLKEFYGKGRDTLKTLINRAKKWQEKHFLEGESWIENF